MQCDAVLGDGGSENGDGVRRGNGGLQRRRGVCKDQIHLVGNKAVGNGGAGGNVIGGDLLHKNDLVAEFLGQSVLKTLRGGIERDMLYKLADTDGINLILRGSGLLGGGSGLLGRSGSGLLGGGGGRRASAGC